MRRPVYFIALGGAMALLACEDQVSEPVAESVGGTEAAQAKIAFVSSRGARWHSPDIYVANSDGTGLTRLTVGKAPAWSWDGSRIAFYRDENAYDRQGIYVMKPDGSDPQFVTLGRDPAWSPDGRLAFTWSGISVINADGSGYRRLLSDQEARTLAGDVCDDDWGVPYTMQPDWSPDGRQIAFVLACYEGWSKILVVNADGSEPRVLVDSNDARSPVWSPDGSRIAANIGAMITTIDLSSGTQATHYNIGISFESDRGRRLDWSPDGRQIIFDNGPPDIQRIFLVTLETGEARQLIPNTFPDYYADFDVAWSRVRPEP